MAEYVVYPGIFNGYNDVTAREAARVKSPATGEKGKDGKRL
jgi:hypothetical protein